MGMSEDDKRNCCLVEIQETEAKYYKTLEDIEKVRVSTGGGSNVRSDQLFESENVKQRYAYKRVQRSPALIDLVITGPVHHRRPPRPPPQPPPPPLGVKSHTAWNTVWSYKHEVCHDSRCHIWLLFSVMRWMLHVHSWNRPLQSSTPSFSTWWCGSGAANTSLSVVTDFIRGLMKRHKSPALLISLKQNVCLVFSACNQLRAKRD